MNIVNVIIALFVYCYKVKKKKHDDAKFTQVTTLDGIGREDSEDFWVGIKQHEEGGKQHSPEQR